MNYAPMYIEPIQCYHLISAKALNSNKIVQLDFFSHKPAWILCLNKNTLSLVKKFYSLNKNFHYPSYILIFSNPETIKKKLGINCDKTDMYWIEKIYRDDVYKLLKIPQVPWIISIEEGKIIYSAHDFPIDFSGLTNYYEEKNLKNDKDNEKILRLKEQLAILKKKIIKHEKKEANYKAEIFELKDNLKNIQSEVANLRLDKNKEKNLVIEPITKRNTSIVPKGISITTRNNFQLNNNEDDFWKHADRFTPEIKDLHDITKTSELWINNSEHQIKLNSKKNWKLAPIYFDLKSLKNCSIGDTSKKKVKRDSTKPQIKKKIN